MNKINQFKNVVPIGYVCDVTSFLTQVNKRSRAYIFDRFGTPMWAVIELMKNNFDEFMLRDNMKCEKLFESETSPTILYDSKYYVRFPFKKLDENRFPHLVDSFHKRKDRFLDLLSLCNDETDPILFIRSEEHDSYNDWGNRICIPEYEEKYKKDEYFHLIEFSKYIKTKYPSLPFKILFLNSKGQFLDEENNIIGIDAPKCNYRDKNIGKEIKGIIRDNEEFLNSNLV
jgi:Putative papain-like cysteine peptidase (DUF1796)